MPKIMTGDWVSSWAMPFVTGYSYNVHWALGGEFKYMLILPSFAWRPTDKGIILRFNYTTPRETYDIQFYRLGKKMNMFTETMKDLSIKGLTLGSWSHNNITKNFFLGIAGNVNGSIIINSINCRKTCEKAVEKVEGPSVNMKWSNSSIWENNTLPKDGDSVIIKQHWNMVLDLEETPKLTNLIIDGNLIINDFRELTTVKYL